MKRSLTAAALAAVFVMPAFAGEKIENSPGRNVNFEQKKAEVLQHLSRKIARDQEEKTCVQAAASPAELRACRER